MFAGTPAKIPLGTGEFCVSCSFLFWEDGAAFSPLVCASRAGPRFMAFPSGVARGVGIFDVVIFFVPL